MANGLFGRSISCLIPLSIHLSALASRLSVRRHDWYKDGLARRRSRATTEMAATSQAMNMTTNLRPPMNAIMASRKNPCKGYDQVVHCFSWHAD